MLPPSDFAPVRYEDEEGNVLWQPAMYSGHRWYFTADGDVTIALPEVADRRGLTPATCKTHRKAVKVARAEWERRIKEHFGDEHVN